MLLCHDLAEHSGPWSGHHQTMLGEWKTHRCMQQSTKEEYTDSDHRPPLQEQALLHHTITEIYH